MMKRGEIATLQEAADLVGVSAQRVGQWCVAAGIDWRATRSAYLNRLWSGRERNTSPRRRKGSAAKMSKAELRQMGEDAAARFWSRYRPGKG